MSLLEDVFLQDEANEAQELERVIEGDEYDERPRTPDSDSNLEKEDEAEEDKRHVDPKVPKAVRVVKNPRVILNPARLTGPRGIQVIPSYHFKDFKFKGKGHEKEDLDMVLKKLEHWAYRLYPKFEFKDCLKKIETLGKKRTVMVHLHKIRSDQFTSEETVVQKDSSDDDEPPQEEDEFDKLLQQQIDLARTATPAPASVRKVPYTPTVDRSILMPKATSSPSISEDQKERMLRNRKLAEERRLAKLKLDSLNVSNGMVMSALYCTKQTEVEIEGITKLPDDIVMRQSKHKSNVIHSSDDDDDDDEGMLVKKSVSVDIHKSIQNNDLTDPNNKASTSENDENQSASLVAPERNCETNSDDNEVHNVQAVSSKCDTDKKPDESSTTESTETGEQSIIDINEQNDKNVDFIGANDNEESTSSHQTTPRIENVNLNGLEEKVENNDRENNKIPLQCPNSVENQENIDDVMDVDFSDDF